MNKITFKYKNKPYEIDIESYSSVEILKTKIKQLTKLPLIQQRLEIRQGQEKIILKNTDTLNQFTKYLKEGSLDLYFKNLGRQIEYRNLFYLEYIGPFILWIIFFILNLSKINGYYLLITMLVLIHYGKRLYESKYVHIFSNPSVPYSNAWRNIFMYWVVFGIFVPIEIFYLRSLSLGPCWFPCRTSEIFFTFIFLGSEYFNYYCHVQLRKLRFEEVNGKIVETKKRRLPCGLFFDQVMCPNYTFEILAWISFVFLSGSFFAALFISFGGYIMYVWGVGKKKKILNSPNFSEAEKLKVKKRQILIPDLI